MNGADPRIYQTHRIHLILALIGMAVSLLFAWTLLESLDWMAILFLVAAIAFALVNLQRMFMRVELTPSGITLHDPFAAPRHVEFRQMVTVSEAGRIRPGVSVVYYPVRANGLVDMEEPYTLFIPALNRQDELLAILRREIPA
jgi:hypothetical protein